MYKIAYLLLAILSDDYKLDLEKNEVWFTHTSTLTIFLRDTGARFDNNR